MKRKIVLHVGHKKFQSNTNLKNTHNLQDYDTSQKKSRKKSTPETKPKKRIRRCDGETHKLIFPTTSNGQVLVDLLLEDTKREADNCQLLRGEHLSKPNVVSNHGRNRTENTTGFSCTVIVKSAPETPPFHMRKGEREKLTQYDRSIYLQPKRRRS